MGLFTKHKQKTKTGESWLHHHPPEVTDRSHRHLLFWGKSKKQFLIIQKKLVTNSYCLSFLLHSPLYCPGTEPPATHCRDSEPWPTPRFDRSVCPYQWIWSIPIHGVSLIRALYWTTHSAHDPEAINNNFLFVPLCSAVVGSYRNNSKWASSSRFGGAFGKITTLRIRYVPRGYTLRVPLQVGRRACEWVTMLNC